MNVLTPAAGRKTAVPDAIAAPGAKFSFWSSMGDLARLVMRSRAEGLRSRLAAALVLVLAGKWTGVYAPLFLGKAVNHLAHGHSAATSLSLAFLALVGGYVGLRFISGAAPLARDAIFTPVSQTALARSAVETFAHSLSLSLDFHQSKKTGALARIIDRGARSTDFLLRAVVFNLGPTVFELALAAWIFTTRYTWRLAAIAVATIAVYVWLTFSISNWRIHHRRALNEADSSAAGMAVDALINYETIKTFGAEARSVEAYAQAMRGYADAAVKSNTSLQLLNAIQSVVLNTGLGLVIITAGLEVAHGRMQVGDVVAALLVMTTLYAPLNILGMNYREIRQAFIDMEQMISLAAIRPQIVDAPDARDLPPAASVGAELVFEHVGFRHGGRSVGLRDIDFRVAPGRTTALVGPSGAGKTTIVRLALRLLDPESGVVRLDGADLREVRQASLRQAVALVPQDVALFNDTLSANIRFARPQASEDEAWRAAEAAELAGFIKALPEGMATLVGERGLKLSGGERQRVGLARALLADPRLLILDEATSALDGPTEAAIQAALRKARAGRTTLIIAHRLSTVMDADEILVIRRGRIVERGGHAELIAKGGEYAALWRRQTRED